MSNVILETIQDIESGGKVTVQELINIITLPMFTKTLTASPAFKVVNSDLILDCDVIATVGNKLIKFSEGAALTLPQMNVGTDYAIYATETGLVVSNNFTAPSGYSTENSRRVAGFHYGDGSIKERSIWDLKYRPNVNDPRGMVRTIGGFWADIYLLNTTPDLLGTSAYNVQIADGSSPPKKPTAWGGDGSAQYTTFTQYIATEVLAAYGKRLPNYHEFQVLAQGSKTGHVSASDPVKTKFDADARSLIGCEQVSGHMWQWGAECWDRGNGSSGYAFQNVDTDGKGQVHAISSEGVGASLFGADWDNSGSSGSRASNWYGEPWNSGSGIAARGVCDHLELL